MKTSKTVTRLYKTGIGLPIIHGVTASGLMLLGYFIVILAKYKTGDLIPWNLMFWHSLPLVLYIFLVPLLRWIGFKGTFLPLITFMYISAIGLIYRFSLKYRHLIENQLQDMRNQTEGGGGLGNTGEIYIGVAALAVILLVILLLWKERINILQRRYYLLFSVSIGFLFLCAVWMKLTGTRFFYSHTPWEFMKIILVISLAGFLADHLPKFRNRSLLSRSAFVIFWIPLAVMWVIPQLLFILMGDMGQLMIYSLFVVLFIYAATGRILYLISGIILLAVCLDVLQMSMPYFPEYIQDRFLVWSSLYQGFPTDEWWNRSCQTFQAFFAIKSGGILGTGPGEGYPGLIPLADSDLAYAGMSELFGMSGVFVLLALYATLMFAGWSIAEEAQNLFNRYLIIGLILLLISQIIINIAGILNIIPLTGITLPFVSKGGFSYITCAAIIGILMVVSDNRRKKPVFSI